MPPMPVIRVGDLTYGGTSHHGFRNGVVTAVGASITVMVNGRFVAIVGTQVMSDLGDIGFIISTSTWLVEGRPIGRISGAPPSGPFAFTSANYTGWVLSGSPNVFSST
jgi:uncharacterized Zn-binding protein involved in type VI secretion